VTTSALIATHCTVCGRAVDGEETVTCGECQKAVHERCAAFECPTCAEELDVGAVEF